MKNFNAILSILLMLLLIPVTAFSDIGTGDNQYIVRFTPQVELDKVVEFNASMGIQTGKIKLINAIVFKGGPQALEALSKNFDVVSIEPDQIVKLIGSTAVKGKPGSGTTSPPPPQSTPWGISRVHADQVWTSSTGNGIKVAIIDTGIDLSHSDLLVSGGVNYVPRARSYADDNGHGTHVAGIVAAKNNSIGVVGIAPDAQLYAVKVLDKNGSGYLSNVILGIEWAIDNNMDVINMSLGSNSSSSSFEAAVDLAKDAGIITVAAAGNDSGSIDYPGAYASTIAVGATDSNDVLAYFSSFGNELDVVAPGVSVFSTYKGNTYKTLSGTSMASPHVAGLAALYLQKYPGADLDSFRAALDAHSIDLGALGFDVYYGNGLIDALQMIQ